MATQSNGQTQETATKMDHNGPRKGDGSSQKASTSKEVGRTAKSKTANTKRKYTTAEKQNKPKNFEKRPTHKNDDQLFRNLTKIQSKKKRPRKLNERKDSQDRRGERGERTRARCGI